MQRRIVLLVMVSIAVVLIGIGIVSYISVNKSINHAMDAHLMVADIISKNIDRIIERNVSRLYDISSSGQIDLKDGNWSFERNALRNAYEHSIFTGGLFITDLDGNIVLSYPSKKEGSINLSGLPYLWETLNEDRTVVSNVYSSDTSKNKLIYMLVPLKNNHGKIIGVAGGEVNPENYFFLSIIKSIAPRGDTCIELVDSYGMIIASNRPERELIYSDHDKFLSNAISRRKSFVVECHRCHSDQARNEQRETDILAFAPLSIAPWGVAVRDPMSHVYAPASALKKSFFFVSLIVIAAAIALSMGLSKSIVRPLRLLTKASEHMARGDLSDSITVNRHDEIGKLATSFETMRQKLDESLKSIQNHNIELEEKVQKRTRELNARKHQLATLLQNGMKQQEDERKRIARELHDETSQALTAIGMSLEIATMSLRDNQLTPDMLLETRVRISNLVDGINRIIHNLRPPVLDDLGLESALKWLFEKYFDPADINYRLCMEGLSSAMLDKKSELMLFRIVQEAVSNIVRHSQAKFVCFSSEQKDGTLTLDIMDTGIGFDAEGNINQHIDDDTMAGYGLLGMQERVSYLNGTLNIHSYPHEGTHVQIRIPAQTREEAYVQDSNLDS